MMPPTGRARNPTARVPNAAMVPIAALWFGKNSGPRTSAEAVV
jgi:hypothetical protein